MNTARQTIKIQVSPLLVARCHKLLLQSLAPALCTGKGHKQHLLKTRLLSNTHVNDIASFVGLPPGIITGTWPSGTQFLHQNSASPQISHVLKKYTFKKHVASDLWVRLAFAILIFWHCWHVLGATTLCTFSNGSSQKWSEHDVDF